MKKIISFSLVMFIFSVMNVMAATWYVDPLGTDDGSHGTTPGTGAFKTIQYAISFSSVVDGDVINIGAATYNQALNIGKSLTLIGAGPSSNPTTIITSTANPMISLSVTGKNFTFQNLIIEGNVTNNGIRANGAININSFTMQDVIARNCQVALYLAEYWPGTDPLTTTVGNLIMDNVTLTNNKFIGAYIGKTVLSGTVTNSTITNNGYSSELPASWQKTGLQFVNFDETSVPHVVVTNSTFINNGAGASDIERTGLILYTAYNSFSANELLTVSGCTFQDHPLYAVRIKNGYQVGNSATINGTFTNNYLDIWFNRVTGNTSSTTNVRRTVEGIKTVGPASTYDYTTIQAAMNVASPNDVINVAAGTYNETVSINTKVSLIGAGSGTSGGTIITKTGGSNGAINLVASGTSALDPILIKDIRIQPIGCAGISVGTFLGTTNTNVAYVKLNNVKVVGTNANPCTEQERGLYVDLTSSLTNLEIIGGSFDNLHYGWYVQKQVSADASNVRYVSVTGTSFSHNSWKGLYAEKLSDAAFTNCTIEENGVYDASMTSGCNYFMPWMSGFDINLKAGTYQNLAITNCEFVYNGLGLNNSGMGTSLNGVGIAIKARGTGNDPSYSGFPATLNGVTITGGDIAMNERGIRIGEPGKDNTTPTAVSVHGSHIAGNIKFYPSGGGTTYGGMINFTTANVDATNIWWGTPSGPYHLTLNPTGTGNAVSDNITFIPYSTAVLFATDANIPVSVTPAPIPLPNCAATIQFSHLGINNINSTITVEKYIGLAGTPASAGTPLSVYFKITATNLVNYTFEATIVLDVSGFLGFDTNTIVMMSSNGTTWVGSNATYNATAHTYTFTTNHFSYIAFTNPLLANEVNLFVSTSSTGYDNTVYPNTSWNTPLTTVPDGFNWTPSAVNHDWTYKVKAGTYYIVPVGAGTTPRSFNVASIKIAWNPNVASGVTVTEGNFFNDGGKLSIFTTNMGSNWVTIDASCLEQNQTPGAGKYIAKLDFNFNNDTSGSCPITIQEVTIYYDDGQNGWQYATPVTQNMGAKFKCYLGDFASATPSSPDMGDGSINGTDLIGFSTAYWSSYTNASLYRSKYDVGPTLPMRYYFGQPHPDGVINVEDLAVFAMGYSKTASGTLPDNSRPIIFALDKFKKEANGTLRLPVKISGGVNDLRVFSMKIRHGSDLEYTGVEMAGEMLEGTNFLIGKSETGKVYTDGASLGTGLSREGTIVYLIFNEKTAGAHSASIESVIARNSGNLDLEVSFEGSNNGLGVPKTFGLNQNYPNPFNPVTKIEYAVPTDVKVTIKIYDMLGREVSTLVNELQKAGYYKVDWNGSSLSSGVYFYQMKAGDFIAVKKMMLIK